MAGSSAADLAKIDPGFSELMKGFPSAPFPDIIDFPTLRAGVAASQQSLNDALLPPEEGITITSSTVKAHDGYDIPIRIYKPDTPPANGSPLVVFYHGGAFCVGDLETDELNCRLVSQNLGCVAVNVDYRLAPEHPFPCGILDSWHVLKWAAANAEALGADATVGFIVVGMSSGGNIAAVLSIKAKEEDLSPPLTGTVLAMPNLTDQHNPPAKYAAELISMEQNKDAPILSRDLLAKFMAAYNPDGSSKLFNVLQLDPAELQALPPIFFQVCGMDPLRDDALVYEKVLREQAGVRTQLNVYPGVPHAFWTMFPDWETSKKFRKDTIQGIRWLLEASKH